VSWREGFDLDNASRFSQNNHSILNSLWPWLVRYPKPSGISRSPHAHENGLVGLRMPTILEVHDLAVFRGQARILDRVSWRVEKGEHWVILGANGSGKTSLLSALTGYLTPSAGSVTLLGEQYGQSDWRELRRRVGIVSSAIRQKVPDWDSAELVVVGGKYAMLDYWGRVTRADREAARRQLRRIGCAALAEREWGVLSQGERQRVLIARALMAEPSVLILDEPCAGLDPVARERFLEFIQKLATRRNSPALIFVTHHVEEITPAFTHALLLRAGKVDGAGKISGVLTSAALSRAFGASLRLRQKQGRWSLSLS
jgi:iron complex transport system ATP-binding protein